MSHAVITSPRLSGLKKHLLNIYRASTSFITNTLPLTVAGDLYYEFNNKHAKNEKYFINQDGLFSKTSDYGVVLHLYHPESWVTVFGPRLKGLAEILNFDLYVTMPASNQKHIPEIRKIFKNANILIVPNKGRDALPFIKTAALLDAMGYKKVLKLHSKKSEHRDNDGNTAESGGSWLGNTLNALIPTDKQVLSILLKSLEDKNTGIIGPGEYYFPLKMFLSHNLQLIKRIMNGIDNNFMSGGVADRLDQYSFFGGTMFWIDLETIRDTFKISALNFQNEHGQTDGTMAHALERVFCLMPQIRNKTVYGASTSGLKKNPTSTFPDWYFDYVSSGKSPISIVVPVYADWSSLAKNIRSLKKYFSNSDEVSVYYVNDCGPDADELERKIQKNINGLANFYYRRNSTNLGFVKTCNIAAFQITPSSNDILLLNSDTKVTKNFALAMKHVLYSEEKIGAVTARSNNATIWSVPMSGRLANYRILSYVLYKYISRHLPDKYITPTIHGFCVLVRREVIEKYELFDEIYGRGYGEENDFAMRIKRKGWKCAVANRAFVFHYESRSFGSEERRHQIEVNEKILDSRYPEYRGKVQEYWNSIREPLK